MKKIINTYKNLKFKNTFFLCISLILFFIFLDTLFIQDLLTSVGSWGYFGAFVAGIFFVSIFTVAPATVVLVFLFQELNPILLSLVAGGGAVLEDYFIFRFFKDRIFEELKPVMLKIGGLKLSYLMQTPYFAWLTPVIGALIIISPFPDEVGIGLMGISKIKTWQFLVISFVLNSIGILLINIFVYVL